MQFVTQEAPAGDRQAERSSSAQHAHPTGLCDGAHLPCVCRGGSEGPRQESALVGGQCVSRASGIVKGQLPGTPGQLRHSQPTAGTQGSTSPGSKRYTPPAVGRTENGVKATWFV
jgi:hypothetical protein